ncbi:MAG: alpha/beta hydrolase [Bacteroidetes bacterium]|nr:alpha/beta hydrolase [Bacteroidota bacterium]
MKNFFFALLIISLTFNAIAQTAPDNYVAAVKKFTALYNDNKPDSIYSMFGPEMTAALTKDKFKATMTGLKEQFGNLMETSLVSYKEPIAVYKASFQTTTLGMNIRLNNANQIIGLYFGQLRTAAQADDNSAAKSAAATSVNTPAIDPSVTESPMVHKTLSATLHGTYTLPKNVSGKIPVVLIIAGSGPTDRDGNSPKLDLATNAYKYLAWGLAKEGIASLRYDKRMIGESVTGNKESDLRFDDYVDDAVELVQMLNTDDRFAKVIVLGHSEGSLIGMLASRGQDVKGYISLAGAGQQADKLVTEQLKATQSTFVQEKFKTLLDSMKKGKTIDNVDPSLWSIARPGIQRYLMSWFRYDPARIIKLLKMPILIIQGNTDLQVSTTDADNLKKAAKSNATEIIIPNMNHILKDAPADRDQNLATYNKPDLPLKAELVPDIVKFVQGLN